MKAMIATVIILLTSQLMANSFDNFGTTTVNNSDIQNIIIKTKTRIDLQTLGFSRSLMVQTPIIDQLNINLLKLNPTLNVNSILAELRKHPDVVYAQLDHKVTARVAAESNDTEFSDQWSMADASSFGIDAINAWATYGTGGKDSNNNDIVVAVVDGGIEITHKDLIDNIWVNEAEIAGNGIDDDNNGYIDDMNGWNGYSNNGSSKSNSHGTHVAGIIGAKGNNKKQVAGVNWDVKIMNVPGSSGNTSVVLTAYKYILDQKKLWLETDGAQGANIVSTNSSFGVDRANCNSGSFPAWNDIYTEMGKVGILSAAATANNDYDVDKVGDVPTGCESPFIISVTNSNNKGVRDYAGFGKKSIDLAAPGTDILSTYSGNSTAKLTGTSMATPHVAGAIAFLNSVASQTLADMFKNDPEFAALEMKRIILETVTQRPSFKDETVSGGILNLNAAAAEVVNYGLGK